MTSTWENETFNIPYQMVDLMEHYLTQKCIRYERAFGEFTAKRTPGGLPPDSSSKDALHIYGVNDEMWERVLRVELSRLAQQRGHTLSVEPDNDMKLRCIRFEPIPPEEENPITFVSYDGAYPNLCSGRLVIKYKGIRYVLAGVLTSGGAIYAQGMHEEVYTGPWRVDVEKLLETQFPPELVPALLVVVNAHIPFGCCGGCI